LILFWSNHRNSVFRWRCCRKYSLLLMCRFNSGGHIQGFVWCSS